MALEMYGVLPPFFTGVILT